MQPRAKHIKNFNRLEEDGHTSKIKRRKSTLATGEVSLTMITTYKSFIVSRSRSKSSTS